ncbi:MAG: hypothetical protein ACSLFA_07710, partial [Mycobacterium sp.]
MWEIAAALRDSESHGDDAIDGIAAELSVAASRIRTVLAYYGAFSEEIDAEIADNERAAVDA